MRAYALLFVAIAAGCHQIVGIEPLRDPPPDAGAPVDAGPTPITLLSPDAKAPDAATVTPACVPSKSFEPFATAAIPDSWTPLVANGGAVDFAPEALSLPLALRASGTLTPTANGRALIRTTRQGPIRGKIDLGFQMSFDSLFTDARISAGCMLELQRADSMSVRARIVVGFGMATTPDGIAASVDVSKNASPATPPAPPAPALLSGEVGTTAWRLVHIHAVADGASVTFGFDIDGNGTNAGSASGLTVPFGEVTSLALSCGVDDATSIAASKTFSLRVDDVALDICP